MDLLYTPKNCLATLGDHIVVVTETDALSSKMLFKPCQKSDCHLTLIGWTRWFYTNYTKELYSPQMSRHVVWTSADAMLFVHYNDVIMRANASQITSLTTVYLIYYSGTDQRKRQSSASLDFVQGIHRLPVNSPLKGPVTRKCFHLMTSSCQRMGASEISHRDLCIVDPWITTGSEMHPK